MNKDYNQWYWKIYRWFKWDAKHFHRDVIQGFKNLWRWFPIVWKDRDLDNHYIFEPIKFKLKNTAKYFETKQRFVGWEKEVKYLRICEKLIQKIQDDYYQSEHYDYLDLDIDFVPVEGKDTYELKSNTTRDDLDSYILKYPRIKKMVLKNPKYKNYINTNKGISLSIGIERHNKAKKLLFKILEERIEYWWD